MVYNEISVKKVYSDEKIGYKIYWSQNVIVTEIPLQTQPLY